MKTMSRYIQTLLIFSVVIAMTHPASAAKKWTSMTLSYSTTNIQQGVATTVANTVTLLDGNGGSSVGNFSNCFYSVSVAPNDPTLTYSLSVTNFTSQNNQIQNNPGPPILTLTITSFTPSNTYVVTIWANNNPSNQHYITTISNEFTITMLPTPPPSPVMVWTPAGVDTNWSTAGNWASTGPP